jgi:hypothetical protein
MQWNGVRTRRRAGVAPRVRGRVGNVRGLEARQGAMRILGGDTYPAIHVLSPPTSYRKRAGAGLHERPMRELAKAGPAKRPGAFPQRFARGDGSPDHASDEAGMVGCGALRRERCSGKMRMAPCGLPSACRSRRPQGSPVRRAGHSVAQGEPTTASRHAWRATKYFNRSRRLAGDPVTRTPSLLCGATIAGGLALASGPACAAARCA